MQYPNPQHQQLNMEAQWHRHSLDAEQANEVRYGEQVREARQTDEYSRIMHRRRVRLVIALVVVAVVVGLGLALLALSGRL